MENERQFYLFAKDGNLKELIKAFEENVDVCNIKPYGQSLLLHAVLENQMKVLEFLITKGCDLNEGDKNGLTPLHIAALDNKFEAAKKLLAAGAEVDVEDKFGNTPLFRAVYSYQGDLSMISLLIQHGASPFHVNKSGVSPQGFAQKTQEERVVNFFREQGFSPN